MPSEPRPPRDKYARVYHGIARDPKFDTVFPDDRHLATWLRLLLAADASWPSYPPIPRTVRKASFDALVAVGLVDLMPGDCYRIHGLDKERSARAEAASNAAAKRWQSGGNAPAMRPHSASNAEVVLPDQTRPNQTKPEQGAPADGDDDAYDQVVAWLASRKAWVDSPKIQTDLARMVDRKGAPAVIEAMANLDGAEDAAQFVYGARNALFPLTAPRPLSKEDRERAEARRALGLA